MEILFKTISVVLIIFLISFPILLFRRLKKIKQTGKQFLTYLLIGSSLSTVVIIIFSWWGNYSTYLLLEYYGFNLDALSIEGQIENVKAEHIDYVNRLFDSLSSVGWPLTAMFSSVFYFPYFLSVYYVGNVVQKEKRRKSI